MNEQETWWANEGGNEYTKRNRVNWRARIPFWHDIMKFTGARSVYEVGANVGYNLSAIKEIDANAALWGCEVNEAAAMQAHMAGLNIDCCSFYEGSETYELVFTAGVLIHVAPENLSKLMSDIVSASTHYVLAIEYAAEQEEMIDYRGQPNLLWKRPYGKLYEDMGLKLLHSGEATGFDRCTYWLLSKD